MVIFFEITHCPLVELKMSSSFDNLVPVTNRADLQNLIMKV